MEFLRDSVRQTAYLWPLAVVRILSGHMWARTSLFWIRAEDRAASLTDQVTPLLESGRPTSWYQPFLEHVVLPNSEIFAALVTAGEAFVAVSLLLGVATRVGAVVSMCLAANYSLLYGQSFLIPSGNTTISGWASCFWLWPRAALSASTTGFIAVGRACRSGNDCPKNSILVAVLT